MASIHHLIGWHAWLLPSSPWQCECPPASHHHGNGSVPQQPSAWAECKPLNQDHHGNMWLPKRRAVVCLWVWVCFGNMEKKKITTVIWALPSGIGSGFFFSLFSPCLSLSLSIYHVLLFCHCLSPAQFPPSHCINIVGRCCDISPVLSGAWQEA